MARLFDDANQQYFYNANAVAAVPLSMACWFACDDLTGNMALMAIQAEDGGAGFDGHVLWVYGSAPGDYINASTQNKVSGWGTAAATAGPSLNVWTHACGVWSSISARAAYLNGANKGTDAALVAPAGPDRTYIGASRYNNSVANYHSGCIAEAGIWSVALTDADVAALATGISPVLVQPEYLEAYWPLIGRFSPEIDAVGGYGMTSSPSAPTVADHVRIRYAARPLQWYAPLGVARQDVHYYRQRV